MIVFVCHVCGAETKIAADCGQPQQFGVIAGLCCNRCRTGPVEMSIAAKTEPKPEEAQQ